MTVKDEQLLALERQIKRAIRDAVNRASRKPFYWGGLAGYRQLLAIADALRCLVDASLASAYLCQCLQQVERALHKNRALAQDLTQAHLWLRRIAAVLHYRLPAQSESHTPSSTAVAAAMTQLLAAFQPDGKHQPAQTALADTLDRLWHAFGPDLLHCYDIPGLPPDNLAIEALFGRLRRHQRRISGRKSTKELREFGHYQVLFQAQSEQDLLAQLRTVPLHVYQQHRDLLAETEAPRRFLHRLHRDPHRTMQHWVDAYLSCTTQLAYTR